MIPVYAPIPDVKFDAARMTAEIETICLPKAVERSVIFNGGKSVYDTSVDLKISSAEQLADTTHYREREDGSRETIKGQYSTYHVLNLTRVERDPNTEWLTYLERRGLKINFWHYYLEPWAWMKELEGSYLQTFINQLPFEYLQAVRLVSMTPPAIGQVHVDANKKANRAWMEKGFGSMTLNVSHGGSYLKFSVGDEVLGADPEVQVSHFDDSYHHGVPELTSSRHQIRIFGKIDCEKYLAMMDLSKAVWDRSVMSETGLSPKEG